MSSMNDLKPFVALIGRSNVKRATGLLLAAVRRSCLTPAAVVDFAARHAQTEYDVSFEFEFGLKPADLLGGSTIEAWERISNALLNHRAEAEQAARWALWWASLTAEEKALLVGTHEKPTRQQLNLLAKYGHPDIPTSKREAEMWLESYEAAERAEHRKEAIVESKRAGNGVAGRGAAASYRRPALRSDDERSRGQERRPAPGRATTQAYRRTTR